MKKRIGHGLECDKSPLVTGNVHLPSRQYGPFPDGKSHPFKHLPLRPSQELSLQWGGQFFRQPGPKVPEGQPKHKLHWYETS